MSQIDGSGQRYEQFLMSNDEHIRVTRVPHADWASEPTLRVQKVMASGKTVQGPEFPARLAGELAKALHDVMAE
jgi:hypothetical protein